MIQYIITANQPNRHYIDIALVIDCAGCRGGSILFHLPAWRPGRYELANYARNIQYWRAFNEQGQPLCVRKRSKDCWEVRTASARSVTILYNYYAFELDAGSCFFDDQQLYVNPVNCLLYVKDRMNEPCSLALTIPAHYRLASGLPFNEERVALARDYHELVDSPFIASGDLQQKEYFVGNYRFLLSVQGKCRPDWERMLKDLVSIATAHIDLFGAMPVREFHFLYHLLPVKAYHGVEHAHSCVICFGPGYRLMEDDLYKEYMGISSHELFHCWNIKSIRPRDLLPYNYSKESYSHLGYVSEGVTTYYGDVQLLRSGIFSWQDYASRMSGHLTSYFHNEGRHFQTLAESSFDTWVDGYKDGAPDRKISMYVKGAIIAFLQDMEIRRSTRNSRSFDHVMRRLYYDFAQAGKGYSEEDYMNLINETADPFPPSFFEDFVEGLKPLDQYIPETVQYIGCTIHKEPAGNIYERIYGMKCKKEEAGCAGNYVIIQIAPESPADKAGLSIGDEIIAVNDARVADNLNELFTFYRGQEIVLTLYRSGCLILAKLFHNGLLYFPTYQLVKSPGASATQKENFRLWAGREF
jgi:predicted metalloprotease with PDZ domain